MATKGIDVSVWQGAIDFNAVRNSGVDFRDHPRRLRYKLKRQVL